MDTLSCICVLTLGLLHLDSVNSHASVCEPEARTDPSVFKECVDEILMLGDFFTPFIKIDDKLQGYMEPKFSSPAIIIEETMCCTKPAFEYRIYLPSDSCIWAQLRFAQIQLSSGRPMSKSINCLAFEPHPAVLYYDAPQFEWQLYPDANISENDMFTMVMLSLSNWRNDHNLGYPERPPLHWLVVDIQGFDWKKGKQLIPYNSPVTTDTFLILYYKQHHSPIAGVAVGPYASFGEGCPINYKNACIFQLERYVKEQMLTLVATTWFMVTADQFSSVYSINHLGKSPAQACPLGFPGLKPMEDGYNVNCNNAPSLAAATFATLAMAFFATKF